jgi:hypothetical protein
MSQADSSQKLPSLESTEWHLANEQRLVAIELQREKVQVLEQTLQRVNQESVELELRRNKDNVLSSKEGIRELDRQVR